MKAFIPATGGDPVIGESLSGALLTYASKIFGADSVVIEYKRRYLKLHNKSCLYQLAQTETDEMAQLHLALVRNLVWFLRKGIARARARRPDLDEMSELPPEWWSCVTVDTDQDSADSHGDKRLSVTVYCPEAAYCSDPPQKAPMPLKPATDKQISTALTRVFDQAGDNPPNMTTMWKPVQNLLELTGRNASKTQIQAVGAWPAHKKRRRTPGTHRKNP